MAGEIPVQVMVELLNRRFDTIEAGIDRVDGRIDVLAEQVREANGRTSKNESAISGIHPLVNGLRREMGEVKDDIKGLKQPKDESGENRRIRAWDVGLLSIGIGVTITFLKLIGKL